MLCQRCEEMVLSVVQGDFSNWTTVDGCTVPVAESQARDHGKLEASAEDGCEICAYFLQELSKSGYVTVPRRTGVSVFRASYASFDPNASFRLTFCAGELGISWSVPNPFEIFQTGERAARAQCLGLTKLELPRQPRADPLSGDCISLAQSWMEECEGGHTCCHRAATSRLPTRVIDVGCRGQSQMPKVLITNKMVGRYITLSYCWGKSGYLTTTSENIHQHTEGIPFDRFPKTLRDAIIIARLLGFRYLWVDALCIVQNDPEDWAREAAMMSTVYENAALSLSALASEHSNAGILSSRRIDGVTFKLKDRTLGIRAPVGSAKTAIPGSPLERRAWTLQERILAPAVLHFGVDELYWECCGGLASESFPEIRKPTSGHNDSYYGMSVHDMKSILRGQQGTPSMTLWFLLVEHYTGRVLSNKSDRLAAMQGLASRFAYCTKDTQQYGIWSEHVNASLLWRANCDLRTAATRIPESTVPTWSWASLVDAVSYPYGYNADRVSKAEIHILPERPNVVPALYVKGLYADGFFLPSKRPSRERGFYCAMSGMSLGNEVHCSLDNSYPGWSGNVLDEQSVPDAMYCLLISEDAMEGRHVYHFLIIEPAGPHKDFPQDKVFKRVGVGLQEIATWKDPHDLSKAEYGTLILV